MEQNVPVQELIDTLSAQRNAAQNEVAIATARFLAGQKEIESLKARIAELEKKPKKK